MLKQQFERLEEFFNDIFEGALTFTTQKPAKAINTDIILEWGDILSWGIFALLLIFFVFIIILLGISFVNIFVVRDLGIVKLI